MANKNLPRLSDQQVQEIEDIIEKHKKREPTKYEEIKQARNISTLHHTMRLRQLPRLTLNNAEEIRQRTDLYLMMCLQDGVEATYFGWALACGHNLKKLEDYASMRNRAATYSVAEALTAALTTLASLLEQYAQGGDIPQATAKFLLSNHAGLTDKVEHTVVPNFEGLRLDNPMAMEDLLNSEASKKLLELPNSENEYIVEYEDKTEESEV